MFPMKRRKVINNQSCRQAEKCTEEPNINTLKSQNKYTKEPDINILKIQI
jgi:hypothetical protein